jgi:hypothetical protein
MCKLPIALTDPAEAAVLDHLEVRLIAPHERPRWGQLVSEKHYLRQAHLVGEQLRYGAEYQGQWLEVERGHGRIEWRGIEVREVTPEQMGFPHAAQVARVDRLEP